MFGQATVVSDEMHVKNNNFTHDSVSAVSEESKCLSHVLFTVTIATISCLTFVPSSARLCTVQSARRKRKWNVKIHENVLAFRQSTNMRIITWKVAKFLSAKCIVWVLAASHRAHMAFQNWRLADVIIHALFLCRWIRHCVWAMHLS